MKQYYDFISARNQMFVSSKWIFYNKRKEKRSHKKLDLKSPCNRECSRKRMTIMTKELIQSYRMADPKNKGWIFLDTSVCFGLKNVSQYSCIAFLLFFQCISVPDMTKNSFKLNHSIFSLILMYNSVMKFCIKNKSMSIICEISAYNLSRLNWNW